ncbi:ROK family transcriptional regulator [Konateibacter massiliensis]|uniref:ROK family transcriptional regulator n=1 Tax=Konateibacter massiliensis TaxID=2002841 RepID=UPI000C154EAA|nr:ROK family transcriptional regulator [Konateibacter massiliensis]
MRDTIGNNNSDLTEMNRSAVVKILQQREICSRADIAKQMGLTQASITKIVAALMGMGIVSEVGSIKGSGNRRSIGLKLNADRHQIIGVKFARHMFAVGVFDISGKIYTQTETEYPLEQDQRSVLSAMKKQIHDMLKEYKNVAAIGLAVPGPYLRTEGRIAMVTRMPDWHNINFIEEFKDEFNKPFFIEQDANAGALAEWWFGDHDKSMNTLAYFLAGEGIGSGIIDRGSLLLGSQGAASEIGHISIDAQGPRCECGNYGCLEMYCSAPVILKLAKQRVPECFAKGNRQRTDACNAVFEEARRGDLKALELVKEIAEYIGYGCVTLINSYNPDIIVIGDSVSKGGDLLLPTIQEVVNQRTIPELHSRVKIKISSLKVDPTLYGAAAIATNRVLQMPSAFLAVKEEEVNSI